MFFSLTFMVLIAFYYFRLPGAKQNFINNQMGFFINPSILNNINIVSAI